MLEPAAQAYTLLARRNRRAGHTIRVREVGVTPSGQVLALLVVW